MASLQKQLEGPERQSSRHVSSDCTSAVDSLHGKSPDKVDMAVLAMVSQSCIDPALPAEVVLKTRLPPWLPAPAISCITSLHHSCSSRKKSARIRLSREGYGGPGRRGGERVQGGKGKGEGGLNAGKG